MRAGAVAISVGAALIACTTGTPRRATDAFVPPADAGSTDPDGGPPPVDAGHDAGPPDAGPPDAGDPDAGPPCSESPCRIVTPQCGCPEGEGCYIDGSGVRACQPEGRVAPGVRCAGIASCRPGYVCVGSRSVTFCHQLCDSDGDCPGVGSLCVLSIGDGMGGSLPDVVMCSVDCDPTAAVGCPTGAGCQLLQETDGAMRTYTHCMASGPGSEGATCASALDCRLGYGCIGSTCRQYCIVGVAGGCATGSCAPFPRRALVGFVEYGTCM